MIDPRIAAKAAGQYGVIQREQTHRFGMTDRQILHRVRQGEWIRLHRQVFLIRPAPLTIWARAMAAVLAVGGGAVVVGCTGAFLLRLLEREPKGPIEVIARRRIRLDDVKAYVDPELPHRPKVFADRIPVAPLATTIFFAARALPEDELGSLIEIAWGRRGMKMHKLEAEIVKFGGKGANGTASLRRQIALRAGRQSLDSTLEEMFLPYLIRRGLRPQLQFKIYEGGKYMRRGDFVVPDAKVDAETDGYKEHGGLRQFDRDRAIDRELMRHGWIVPRYTYWDVVERPDEAADHLAELVEVRRREFGLAF